MKVYQRIMAGIILAVCSLVIVIAVSSITPSTSLSARIHYKTWDMAEISVSWLRIQGADGYQVIASPDEQFRCDEQVMTTKDTHCTSVFTRSGNHQEQVFFKMRPYKKLNGQMVYDAWTDIKSVTVS